MTAADEHPSNRSTADTGTATPLATTTVTTKNPISRMTTTRRTTCLTRTHDTPQQHNVVRNSLLAGSVAGICSTASCYPFDVLRTKMQAAAAAADATTTAASHSTRPFQVLVHTFRHGGIRGLYTGLTLPLTAQAVYKATVFTVNNCTQQVILEWKTQEALKLGTHANAASTALSLTDRFLCGCLGGAVNGALFVTPVEYVRNTLIAQHTRLAAASTKTAATDQVVFSGPRHVLHHTIVEQGRWWKLWRGLGITVARDSIGCGCFFVTFQLMSERLVRPEDHEVHHPTWNKLVAGGAAGLAYWVAALMPDTAKTWVQNGTADSATAVVRELVQQRGVRGAVRQLTRAWKVALGRGMPAAAITMAVYEYCYKYLQQM